MAECRCISTPIVRGFDALRTMIPTIAIIAGGIRFGFGIYRKNFTVYSTYTYYVYIPIKSISYRYLRVYYGSNIGYYDLLLSGVEGFFFNAVATSAVFFGCRRRRKGHRERGSCTYKY